ncbi:MAG: MFS transporter [Acidimicrobiaceae bacterium]|nr:MFS transporter [Acidimicrobiaceae bacterium]
MTRRDDANITRAKIFDRVTWALSALALFAGFAQFGAVASLADVAKHFGHVSTSTSLASQVGLSGSVLGLGLAALRLASLGALPLASLADRLGRIRLVRQTLWFGLAITAAAALSPNYWIFVACFALGRPLLSTASTLLQVMTVELSSTATRVGRLAVVGAGGGAGAGLSAILHGAIRSSGSFRWLFALAIVPVVVVGVLLRVVPEPPTRDATLLARIGGVSREYRGLLWRVAMVVGVLGMIGGPANGFVFVYGESILHISPPKVALMVSGAAVTGLVGLMLSRWLADKWGRRTTAAAGLLASGLSASLAYGGGKALFVAGYLVGVGAAGLVTPVISALGTEIFPHHVRATAAGWLVVAGVLGATIGLALFGVVGDVLNSSGSAALRWPALITFVPMLWTAALLRALPDSAQLELV